VGWAAHLLRANDDGWNELVGQFQLILNCDQFSQLSLSLSSDIILTQVHSFF
jgi:hypothetical protein